jgi:guanylate kinase
LQEKKNKGCLFVVSAPSGAGKTTLCSKIVSCLPHLRFSVSYTTRLQRPGEVNDRDYTFISREDFRFMAERGEFIEWAEVHGEYYGTSKKRLEEILDSGNDVILDIDTQGAMQIKNRIKEGTYIFILPPSLEILRKRLADRMTDAKKDMEKRLKMAVSEIKTYQQYDYVIINDKLEASIKELQSIIISQRVRTIMVDMQWIKERFLKEEDY